MKRALLSILSLLATASMLLFTACGESCEQENQNFYLLDLVAEQQVPLAEETLQREKEYILNAFMEVLGIRECYFRLDGPTEECNEQVKQACQTAALKLEGQRFEGSYTLTLYRDDIERVLLYYWVVNPLNMQQIFTAEE